MCEVQDTMPRRKRISARSKGECHRCGGKSRYLVRALALCSACFENNMHAHFVRSVHPPLLPPSVKSSQPRPFLQTGGVVVALSGGAGSTALIDLLGVRGYVGAEERDIKKGEKAAVWSHGWAVHVDFGNVVGVEKRGERLRAIAEERGFQFVSVLAEDAFDERLGAKLRALGGKEIKDQPGSSVVLSQRDLPLFDAVDGLSPLESLKALLAALPPPSRPALLQHILDALLSAVAGALPVQHLLSGETSTSDAARVIAGTARGAGWSLPLDLQTARELPNGVVRIRGMKDANVKEAALWCHARGLATSAERRWDAGGKSAPGKEVSSLEALTERFIAGLSTTHPATVTTITKTAAKLTFMGDGRPLCPLCERPVDDSATEWKQRAALTSLPGRGTPETLEHSDNALAPLLCYACLTTFTPLTAAVKDRPPTAPVPLPTWVGERSRQRQMTEDDMRQHIASHLL